MLSLWTLAIPPCTWDEIPHIRLAKFGDLAEKNCPVNILRQRFDLWGGVPRTLMYDRRSDGSHADAEFNKWKVADRSSSRRNTLLGKLRLGPRSPFGKDFPSISLLQNPDKRRNKSIDFDKSV